MTDRQFRIRRNEGSATLWADVEQAVNIFKSLGHGDSSALELDPEAKAEDLARRISARYHTDLAAGSEFAFLEALVDRRFCGVPDPAQGEIQLLTYGAPSGRWGKSSFTYSVDTTGCVGLSPNAVMTTVASAFNAWSIACPVLTFTGVVTGGDFQLSWGGSNLDSRFGVRFGVLGSAAPPPSGRVNFDSAEQWTSSSLASVALHEIGHSLGLAHSTRPDSLMYPFKGNANIDGETKAAINLLYGFKPQTPLFDRGSEAGPALAICGSPGWVGPSIEYSEQLFMAWRGVPGDDSIYWSMLDNNTWTPQRRIDGIGSSSGPALFPYRLAGDMASFGLIMAWKGVNDDTGIYFSINREPFRRSGGMWDPAPWEPQTPVPGVGTSHRPALAELNGRIVMAWKGIPGDSRIFTSTYDGSNWNAQQDVHGVGTSEGPCLVATGPSWVLLKQRLHMIWKGVAGDSSVWHQWRDNNGIWSGQRKIEYPDVLSNGVEMNAIGTSAQPAAVGRPDGSIFLAWKGVPGDSSLWTAVFSEIVPNTAAEQAAVLVGQRSGAWNGQVSIPEVGSSTAPAVALARGQLKFAWKGISGDTGLYETSL